jgi:hypothetical protein
MSLLITPASKVFSHRFATLSWRGRATSEAVEVESTL